MCSLRACVFHLLSSPVHPGYSRAFVSHFLFDAVFCSICFPGEI